ncbi:hypothetical protein E1211_28985 [Micromonospora sp. 15K316]|uniref:hypothetical protein n=1 Tax=Micromonospora sp. 15K316 TaxID=2530376 RepID=UPI00104EA51D|nr:hypothetical protein [Micromonospora sp. 15K316]TDC27658.1 hypothetical protein E1211_28985 [Micromonospora sp. 15K316]
MTRAPANLLAVRSLLLSHLNVDKIRVRDVDLEPAEVGVVGDPAHRGGYHCGSDRVVNNDYSVVESPRDRNGLTLDAAALDVGQFRVTSGGRTHDLRSFSTWCVGQCTAGAADTRDIREIIYSPDGRVVRRWDRLGRRSSGDDSHLWHTHFSFFRDSIKAGRDQTPLFRRYLTSTGLLEDDMPSAKEIVDELLAREVPSGTIGTYTVADLLKGGRMATRDINRARAEIAAAFGRDVADEQAIVAGVLAGLTPERIAAAIPPTMAQQVAEELARRLEG